MRGYDNSNRPDRMVRHSTCHGNDDFRFSGDIRELDGKFLIWYLTKNHLKETLGETIAEHTRAAEGAGWTAISSGSMKPSSQRSIKKEVERGGGRGNDERSLMGPIAGRFLGDAFEPL